MELTPRERDKLLLFTAALLADNRPALRLMATMTDRLVSSIDHGVTDVVADLAA